MINTSLNLDILIAEDIRCQIFEDKTLLFGQKLPSEVALCKQYNCSKTTLKQALETLSNENVINKIKNSWYVVDNPRIRKYVSKFVPTSQLFDKLNINSTCKLVHCNIIPVTKELADITHFSIGTDLFFLERIRYIDGLPTVIERDYFIKSYFPNLDKNDFESKSLHSILKDNYSTIVDRSVEQVKAISANQIEAKHLNIDINTPLLKQYGLVYSNKGDVIEYSECIVRIERFEYIR